MTSRFSTHPRSIALIAGMALGSIVMWVVIPAVWILLAAQISSVGSLTMGPMLLVLVGAPITMIPVVRMLSWLDHRHLDLMGEIDDRRKAAPWRQSMRDADHEGPRSVLAIVMVISVAIAFGAFGIYFLFLGGAPPGSVSAG